MRGYEVPSVIWVFVVECLHVFLESLGRARNKSWFGSLSVRETDWRSQGTHWMIKPHKVWSWTSCSDVSQTLVTTFHQLKRQKPNHRSSCRSRDGTSPHPGNNRTPFKMGIKDLNTERSDWTRGETILLKEVKNHARAVRLFQTASNEIKLFSSFFSRSEWMMMRKDESATNLLWKQAGWLKWAAHTSLFKCCTKTKLLRRITDN